jgi:hypothetical protein
MRPEAVKVGQLFHDRFNGDRLLRVEAIHRPKDLPVYHYAELVVVRHAARPTAVGRRTRIKTHVLTRTSSYRLIREAA